MTTKRFPVLIMPRAERDIDSIFSWLLERSANGARNWLNALDGALDRMSSSPNSLAMAAEASSVSPDLKQCLFKTRQGRTYRAVFIVEDDTVVVLRVRGPGQPPLQPDELDL
jgi:plasmid stabilization system protein ParE